MTAYIIRRLLLMIPTFLGISVLTFLLIQMAPGSPVYTRLAGIDGLGVGDHDSAAIIEQTMALYGLDKPIHVQYWEWLKRLVFLDFGDSFKDHRPVLTRIGEALPVTLQLNLISIFLAYLIAIPLGVFSATHPRTWTDSSITLLLFILYSLPSFWVAMLLIFYFSGGDYFNWFPAHGISSLGARDMTLWQWTIDRAWHFVLPVICLTYASFAALSRYMRSGMIEVIKQDYIRMARAYGFSERVVIFRYALRNSLIPIITLIGTLLPALIGGSVIIEQIFTVPGMGRLMFEAILGRDYPMVMGGVVISAFLTLIGLLISDILYAFVDPRIQHR